MAMAWIWTVLVAVSFLFGIFNGKIEAVSTAAFEGAGAAVTLCLSIGGAICLWSGIMEVMRRSGVLKALSVVLKPLLIRLFPGSAGNKEALEALSLNTSANLLGLGNAATPAGIRAAVLLNARDGANNAGAKASDDMCTLVVLNTASLQLIPATVCTLRATLGAASAFDILPAVWITSAFSVAAGLAMTRILRKIKLFD